LLQSVAGECWRKRGPRHKIDAGPPDYMSFIVILSMYFLVEASIST
jgi:hypothetical protein